MPVGQGQHLLYVDDDDVGRLTTQALLERRGYRVTSVGDAQSALVLLRAEPTAFAMVITDYNMPEMSGLDFAIEVRGLRPDLPIVITSGFVSQDLLAGASRAGVTQVLLKEYTTERLPEFVGNVLAIQAR